MASLSAASRSAAAKSCSDRDAPAAEAELPLRGTDGACFVSQPGRFIRGAHGNAARRTISRWLFHINGFDIHKLANAKNPKFAAITGLLDAAERQARI